MCSGSGQYAPAAPLVIVVRLSQCQRRRVFVFLSLSLSLVLRFIMLLTREPDILFCPLLVEL